MGPAHHLWSKTVELALMAKEQVIHAQGSVSRSPFQPAALGPGASAGQLNGAAFGGVGAREPHSPKCCRLRGAPAHTDDIDFGVGPSAYG